RDRLLPGTGDQHEASARRDQERFDLPRPLAKAGEEGSEGLEELRHLAQQVEPDDLVEERLDPAAEAAPTRGGLQVAGLVEPGLQGDPQSAAVEEADDPRGSFQEVEGLAGRRRVEHDLIEALSGFAARDLEQALDGHVFEDAAEGARELLIE